jgi:DNA-directed RNA polymerase sigma subunit (sigma70/sigma32)
MNNKGIETPAELARLSGVNVPAVYNYMNLKVIPYSSEKKAKEGEFKPSVLKLAAYLEVTPYEMFPIQHLDKPLLTNKAESEMTFEEITQYVLPGQHKPLLEDGLYEPEQIVYENEKCDSVSKMLKTLTKNEETALRMYYGLDGPEKTMGEIGEHMNRSVLGSGGGGKPYRYTGEKGLTTERVSQIINKAERKLRHKSRANELRKFK